MIARERTAQRVSSELCERSAAFVVAPDDAPHRRRTGQGHRDFAGDAPAIWRCGLGWVHRGLEESAAGTNLARGALR
jgi:hypothetical protein